MTTMNISLPQQMKDWVESRTADGRYANSSDYVRDLIRQDQVKQEKIAYWRRLVAEADTSGFDDRTMEDILREVDTRPRAAEPSAA